MNNEQRKLTRAVHMLQYFLFYIIWNLINQNPGGSLTNFNDWGEGGEGGGSDRGSYFIPKKITTSEFIYPKKSLPLLAYPKKSLSPFFANQQNPSHFFSQPPKIDPKKHFWPKFQTQKIPRNPPPPPPPSSLEYVSGAPGN